MVIVFVFFCWSLISRYGRYLEDNNKSGDSPGYLGVIGMLLVPMAGISIAQSVYAGLFGISIKDAEILTNLEGMVIILIISAGLCFGLLGFPKNRKRS